MRAIDVMARNVVTATPQTTVQDAAKLMINHRISGLPIVDADRQLVGIVTEGDLLRRAETGTERQRSGWSEWFSPNSRLAAEYIKSHARRVSDVMSRDVVSVTELVSLGEIAALMETKRIKRVPVLHDGKLVGIVSRANLVRALAMTINERPSGTEADDRAIRDRLLAELKALKWAEVSPANITVKDGIVHLWSSYYSDQEKRALVVAAESIPGVRRVEDHMRPVPAYLV